MFSKAVLGDRDAIEVLLAEIQPWVIAICDSRIPSFARSQADHLDAAQSALLQISDRLRAGEFSGLTKAQFRHRVAKIAGNSARTVMTHLQAKKRHWSREQPSVDDEGRSIDYVDAIAEDPAQIAIAAEMLAAVRQSLWRADDVRILDGIANGESTKDIADAVGCTVAKVHWRLRVIRATAASVLGVSNDVAK